MDIDDILRTSVEQITRSIEPPVPDPAGIRSRGRSRQRRRSLVGIGAAAALLAVVSTAVWYVADQGDGPSPADPSPGTASSTVSGQVSAEGAIWYAEGVLHDDQRSFSITGKLATNLAVVEHGVLYGDDSGNVVYQRQDGSAAIIGRNAPLGPSGDPTSDVAVWFEKRGEVAELVVYDVARDQELDRANLDATKLRSPEGLVGRDQPPVLWVGDGHVGESAVYFQAAGSVWRYDWTSDDSPQLFEDRHSGAIDVGGDVTAFASPGSRGISFRNNEGQQLSTYAAVEPDGALSHDGSYYVGYSPDGSVVIDTATGKARPLDLDSYSPVMGMTWARGNTIVMLAPSLYGDAGAGSVVACDAVSLHCQSGQQVDNFALIVLPTFSGQ